MAYVTITNRDGRQIGQCALEGLAVLGRSPECEIRLHDIMVSREHCGLERADEGWVVVDLYSSNGTVVNGHRIVRHVLREGDELQLGKTLVTFHEGAVIEDDQSRPGLLERPVDPHEALAGTVVDYDFKHEFEAPIERPIVRPTPKPMPRMKREEREFDRELEQSEQLLAMSDSSPTWAAKAGKKAKPRRIGDDRQSNGSDSERAEAEVSDSEKLHLQSAVNTRWKQRVCAAMVEVIVVAGIAGAGILAAAAYLVRFTGF